MSQKEKEFIIWFKDLRIEDIPYAGGKNASLGEMYSTLTPLGINVPNGFAVTAYAYRYFLEQTGTKEKIEKALKTLHVKDIRNLQKHGNIVRKLILKSKLPKELHDAICSAYEELSDMYEKNTDVAVRSSATAEDLPDSSFAGQQETYLNIKGKEAVCDAVKRCFASLFTDRAIAYREEKGFSHFDVALSAAVQKMVRSDIASSGVAFTIDTETGFNNVIVINSIYGLGEFIVQGKVTPDEFILFKPALKEGRRSIITKNFNKKEIKLIYGSKGTKEVSVPKHDQLAYSITDKEAMKLGDWCLTIEQHFSEKRGKYQPMDIEWAKDGKTKELFIVQARPETVHSSSDKGVYKEFRLKEKGEKIIEGIAVGTKIATGKVRVLKSAKNITSFKAGEVLVTKITDPDWVPIMKIASAIVTDEGGRTSHAAIVSRELGIPCIVGTKNATKVLKDGMGITIDCSSGRNGIVYKKELQFEELEHHLDKVPDIKTKILLNVGSPEEAMKNHYLPVKGVGLGRVEFIIMSQIQVHPNALLMLPKLKTMAKTHPLVRKTVQEIERLVEGYAKPEDFYSETLAEGMAKIAAAFWPNPVIIRFSDFKTNEYRGLLGGDLFEPSEENPMLGWRGASRYYDPKFKDAFGLECKAMKVAREEMGLTNIVPMIPFCRTVEEGKRVLEIMEHYGLSRKHDKTLKVYVMCEIPSNVILADEFLSIFDGMSIGSNDLTQLTMGLDRDSGILAHISNENNEAVKDLIRVIIMKCKEKGKYIGICGQAPSDYPEFAEFLVEEGIESMSLNPDTIVKTTMRVAEKEKKIGK